jgi:hypothetical protein
LHDRYERPRVSDYGDLWRMTATFHPLLAQAGTRELSFSTPHEPGGVQQNGGNQHQVSSGDASGGGGSGGGSGGGAGGGGGGGGKLPFTGLAAALVAGVGAGLVGAGDALRRATRRKPKS